MPTVPTGTVTFLFTDIEGSTKLAQLFPDKWESLRARHHNILQQAVQAHDGHIFQIVGDEFCAAFHTAIDAIRAATEAQRLLSVESWDPAPVKVRMGIHTGTALAGDAFDQSGGYTGYNALARVARLMSAGYGGQVLVSLATEELVRDELPAGIGLRDMGKRRLKDLIHPEQIFQLIIPELPTDFPPLKTLNAYRHNLPIQLTTFIGREKEIAEIRQALTKYRLVTLTGAGGTGKTRLSLQVAADLLDHFPTGVWFVELASLANPDLIPQAVLTAFGVGDQPGLTSLQLLVDYLQGKKLLLVLDNCEHLITEIASLVKVLLTSTDELKILATSRENLGVDGELNWYVPSLSLPDIKHLPSIKSLSQYEAVSLFIDRAILAQPDFIVTKDNAPDIAQICCRLDGIPLAIELAAARVKVLDVEQINKRLDDRFSLLTGGIRTALPRHQTLRATIDWSYDLLSDKEKILLRRLSVFVGGWKLEAAEQVCCVDEDRLDIFDLLSHLVDKSLVVMDSSKGEARYRLLETTRHYASEKLASFDEEKTMRDRHCDWYRKLADQGNRELKGSNQLFWLHRLNEEIDNLRAALVWSFDSDEQGMLSVKMVNDLAELWDISGNNISEPLFWFEKAVDRIQTQEETPIKAKALYHLGKLMSTFGGNWKDGRFILEESLKTFRNLGEAYQVDYAYSLATLGSLISSRDLNLERGITYIQEAIRIFQDAGDKRGHGWALNFLCEIKLVEGDLMAALTIAKEGVMLYKSCENRFGAAIGMDYLGKVHLNQGNYQEAKKYLEEAMEVYREFGSTGRVILILNRLGEACRGLDDYDNAEINYRKSLAMSRDFGVPPNRTKGRNFNLGYTVLSRGDVRQAASCFKEALETCIKSADVVDKNDLCFCLACFAAVAVVQGKAETSALLYGAADTYVQRQHANGSKLGDFFLPVDCRELDRYQTLCRSKLGNTGFELLFERGHKMTLEAAIALALEQVENI